MQADGPIMGPTDCKSVEIHPDKACGAREDAGNSQLNRVATGNGKNCFWRFSRHCSSSHMGSAKHEHRSRRKRCQTWQIQAEASLQSELKIVYAATGDIPKYLRNSHRMRACDQDGARDIARHVELDAAEEELHKNDQKRKDDKKFVHPIGGFAKTVSRAHVARIFTSLDYQHTDVDENESQLNQHHHGAVVRSAKGPDREMQREERDADNERHEDPGLLSIFANEQNPACQCQLAAHLERLPPERVLAIIIGQEGSRPAERCRFAGEQRSTACPK
mmetsp:Transcript_13356/g.39446  ORF Transcript_13356/g.39446 Transcript_13356/m.39446 type:complete len:276 (-) Transcript_13356:799-1626(-)